MARGRMMILLIMAWTFVVFAVPAVTRVLLSINVESSLGWWPGAFTWFTGAAIIYGLSGIHVVDQWERLPVMRLGR